MGRKEIPQEALIDLNRRLSLLEPRSPQRRTVIAKELYGRNYKWLSRNEASDMIELLIDTLKENIADGQTVKIAGFGTGERLTAAQ